MNITILQKLKNISIVTFTDILNDKNTLQLIKDYDDTFEYSDDIKLQCDNVWIKLFDEYFELKNDTRARHTIKKHGELRDIRFMIVATELCISTLQNISLAQDNGDTSEDLLVLKQTVLNGYMHVNEQISIKVFDSIESILKRLIKEHTALLNEYNLNSKRVSQTESKAKNNIYASVVNIQNVLGYAISDINKLSVPLYLELEKSAINKSNAQKQTKK